MTPELKKALDVLARGRLPIRDVARRFGFHWKYLQSFAKTHAPDYKRAKRGRKAKHGN